MTLLGFIGDVYLRHIFFVTVCVDITDLYHLLIHTINYSEMMTSKNRKSPLIKSKRQIKLLTFVSGF